MSWRQEGARPDLLGELLGQYGERDGIGQQRLVSPWELDPRVLRLRRLNRSTLSCKVQRLLSQALRLLRFKAMRLFRVPAALLALLVCLPVLSIQPVCFRLSSNLALRLLCRGRLVVGSQVLSLFALLRLLYILLRLLSCLRGGTAAYQTPIWAVPPSKFLILLPTDNGEFDRNVSSMQSPVAAWAPAGANSAICVRVGIK